MKKSKYLLFAGIVCLLATACQKDEDTLANITLNKFIVSDTQFKNNGPSKVALQFSSNKLIYEEGDVVKVNGETYTLSKSGSGSSTVWYANGPEITGSQFYCVYADGVSTTISGFSGNSYHYNLGGRLSTASNKILMGGMTQNNVLTLHPACAIIRLPLNDSYSNVKVGFDRNKVYKEGTLNIASDEVTISGMTYMTGVDQSGLGADFLMMEYNTTEGYWYVAVPVSSSISTKLYFYWEQGGSPVGYVTSGAVTLTKGWVYTAGTGRSEPFTAEGYTKSYFNISAGHAVAFSAGNLQARRVMRGLGNFVNEWQFASAQTTALKSANTEAGQNAKWLDLLGYGTSGNTPSAQPNSSSTSVSDYPMGDIAETDNEWGYHNYYDPGIIYGSTTVTDIPWRTLTKAEWEYLINRSGKVGLATITIDAATHKGLVLLPDYNEMAGTWTMPEGASFNASVSGYSANTFNGDEWTVLENAGAVFLPVTFYRNGTAVNGDNEGYYWTSTGNGAASYVLKITDGSVSVVSAVRSRGCAVRLVATAF